MEERTLASIQRITELVPIKDKDRIELATVQGWHVIVEKGKYKVGDLVVYCQYDTVLPVRKEFEFLRPRAYSPKYNGFRIRNMSMAGVFSEGIVFSRGILPSADMGKYPEGKDVTEILGIRKYDPLDYVKPERKPKSAWQRFLWKNKFYKAWKLKQTTRQEYPENVIKAGEKNVQVVYSKMDFKSKYYLSEKLEGQAAVFYIDFKGKFHVYSHNVEIPRKAPKNNWQTVAQELQIESKLKAYMRTHGVQSMYIGGEIVGPGIQKNIYKLDALDLYVFDVREFTKTVKEGIVFDLQRLKSFCKWAGIKHVPILAENAILPHSSDDILKDSEGMSVLNKKTKREGVIWRKMNGGKGFKAKSKAYQNWWNKKEEIV